jgi:sugar phosphate isomerase/epimerase
LGFSCMDEPLAGLDAATRRRVRVLELRAPSSVALPKAALSAAVRAWRHAGGQYLSMHLPPIGWDPAVEAVTGHDAFRRGLELACELGAAAVTVHAPQVTCESLEASGSAGAHLSAAYAELLGPAAAGGLAVGVENMHLTSGEPEDQRRRYGYTPVECLQWISVLRARLAPARVGIHLDIGHARNNGRFASEFPLGSWYALTGAQATGYHLHQVHNTPSGMVNHRPFAGLYGPVISLSSFLWAWNVGQLAHAPMFLEVRGVGQSWTAWDRLRASMGLALPGGGPA